MKKYKIGIIGISGFGKIHLSVAQELEKESILDIKAVCTRSREESAADIELLEENGVRVYTDYNEMLNNEKNLDFVSIPTPIHLHKPMYINAMKKGINVLLEKPPVVRIQDVLEMSNIAHETKKKCQVNFMHTSSLSFNQFLQLIKDGIVGQIKNIKGKGLYKRLDSYFERNLWAGKLKVNEEYVLDGSITNALAHLLNGLLFTARSSLQSNEKKNFIQTVQAELYHAHEIEGDDLVCLRMKTVNQIEILCYITLCAKEQKEPPVILVEGEKGTISWGYDNKIVIQTKDLCEIKQYDRENLSLNMFQNFCEVLDEKKEMFCSLEDTEEYVRVLNAAYISSEEIHGIGSEYIKRSPYEDSVETWIINIEEIINKAFRDEKLFSEMKELKWGRKGKVIDVQSFSHFEF